MDGIEQCGGNPQSKNETSIETENGEKSTFETTSTTTSTTTLSTTTATSTTTTTTTSEKQEEASRLIMRTCEDLMNAGNHSDDLNTKHFNTLAFKIRTFHGWYLNAFVWCKDIYGRLFWQPSCVFNLETRHFSLDFEWLGLFWAPSCIYHSNTGQNSPVSEWCVDIDG